MKPFVLFTILVLALTTLPIVAQVGAQGDADFEVKDTRGDVNLFGFTPVALPSTPATDPADILALRFSGEDIEGFNVELDVANLKPSPDVIRAFSGAQFSVQFTLEGSQIQYTINFYAFNDQPIDPVSGTAPTGLKRIPADFYLCVPNSGCYNQRVMAHIDWEKSMIKGYIPKGGLAGREPLYAEEYPSGVPSIRAGSRLSSIQAIVFGNFGTSDMVPDSGFAGPYVLKSGIPNERIGLSLVEFDEGYSYGSGIFGPIADFPSASVTPGVPTLVQVRVSNFNEAKRIINISAGLVDPAQAGKWNVRVVNTLTIPGGDHRIVNLIVNATPEVKHRDETLVRLTARSLGFADEIGSLRLRLIGAVPPTPEKNTLYLHIGDTYGSGILCIGCGGGYVWMNTLESDPLAQDDAGMPMGYGFYLTGTDYNFDAVLDTQLTHDLVMDTTKNIRVTIVTQCSPCPTGTMTLELLSDEGPIATGSATYGTTVEVEMMPLVERVSSGSYIGLFGSIEATGPPPLHDTLHPKLIGSKSKVELPIMADPEAKPVQRIPLGPAFLTLSADNATGQFVAPGKSKVLVVTIVNEGIEEDVVTIESTHEPESWQVNLQPGDKFRLKPGESATFGVAVRAPEDATEGELVRIMLNATSEIDQTALSQLALDMTASENAVEDEENFTVDEDTEKALEAPEKKSPGLGVVAPIVVAAALVVLLRRRR